jgi:stage V sporulation protein G
VEISEVRVKLVRDDTERLRAFCSITLDDVFVVRDLKVIEGIKGPFVAMPSRKLADRCPKCGGKNHLRARHCNECGTRLRDDRAPRDAQGRVKLHADVAHPINTACRERIQEEVIQAYQAEAKQAEEEGYEPRRVDADDFLISDYEDPFAEPVESSPPAAAPQAETRRDVREEHPRSKRDTQDKPPSRRSRQRKEDERAPSHSTISQDSSEEAGDDDFASGIL